MTLLREPSFAFPRLKSKPSKPLIENLRIIKRELNRVCPHLTLIVVVVVIAAVENVKAGVKLSVQKLVVPVDRGRLIVSNFVIPHRIYELVSAIPGVQFFVAMIVSDRCRPPEGICEAQRHIEQLHGVEVECESDFGVSFGGGIDCVENAAHDEHLADLRGKGLWIAIRS